MEKLIFFRGPVFSALGRTVAAAFGGLDHLMAAEFEAVDQIVDRRALSVVDCGDFLISARVNTRRVASAGALLRAVSCRSRVLFNCLGC